MSYNDGTVRTAFKVLGGMALLSVICVFAALSHRAPPRLVSPYPWFVMAVVPSGTTGAILTTKLFRPGKLDERFQVVWPPSLKVAIPEVVVVRIAANDYEDLLAGIDPSRKVKSGRFKGEAKLEVTLTPDSGLEVVNRHGAVQIVVRGQSHREWSWSVLPKTTGSHQLILLVQGISGNNREDYDPEVMQYEVAFNLWHWLSNGLQQNLITWALSVISLAIGFWLGKRKSKIRRPPPNSTDPQAPKCDP